MGNSFQELAAVADHANINLADWLRQRGNLGAVLATTFDLHLGHEPNLSHDDHIRIGLLFDVAVQLEHMMHHEHISMSESAVGLFEFLSAASKLREKHLPHVNGAGV